MGQGNEAGPSNSLSHPCSFQSARFFFAHNILKATEQETNVGCVLQFSSIAWTKDELGFFYCRYPTPEGLKSKDEEARGKEMDGTVNAKLYYHVLGTCQSDDLLVGLVFVSIFFCCCESFMSLLLFVVQLLAPRALLQRSPATLILSPHPSLSPRPMKRRNIRIAGPMRRYRMMATT